MYRYVLILLLFVSFLSVSYSQREPDNLKIGIQFNPLLPYNEFNYTTRLKLSYIVRIAARFGMADYLNGEAGAGYGLYRGEGLLSDQYTARIYPLDFRLLIKFNKKDSYPYILLGAGVMYYDVITFPHASPSPKQVKEKGLTGIAPAGLGYQFTLNRYIHMDINAGVTFSTTDNLNYYKEGDVPDVYYFAGIGLFFGANAPRDDDGDGLLNDHESDIGTDPDNPDTDGDGLSDGEEVLQYMTDPLNKDTDGDGLSDRDEIRKYKTDPVKADSDNDGLSDGDEILTYRTDPMNADTDGDGLTDGDEVNRYKTDPLNRDTDKDNLSDGDEVLKYKTDPLKSDTDEDGINDDEEVLRYKTDPLNKDTDGGSIMDGVEIRRGTDPLNPEDDILKVGKPLVLKGINFDFNSAEITPESALKLERDYKTLVDNPDVIVEIAGHTDEIGTDEYNNKLSLQRAEAVKQWLVERGIDKSRLTAAGYGKQKPVAPNDTPENRSKNRRIEFIRIK